jgi:hypothetical protein
VIGLSQRPIPNYTKFTRETSKSLAGFESGIAANDEPQIIALNQWDGLMKKFLFYGSTKCPVIDDHVVTPAKNKETDGR